MEKKIKIFAIGDMCVAPSGVGTQLKYIFDALIKSGKFTIRQFGGAVRHANHQPVKLEEYGDDLIIYPVDGFGTKEMVRSFLRNERPDIILLMADPRFLTWFFEMANEIRPMIPIVWHDIWDCPPTPTFNRPYYSSCDKLVNISKLTHELVSVVAPEVDQECLGHAVDDSVFKPLPVEDVAKFRNDTIPGAKGKMLFFWNNRNARRKNSGTLVFWFKEFLDIVGYDKAALLMKTYVKDENGPDLEAVIRFLGLTHGEVLFAQDSYPPQVLSLMYNMSDCTINIANAEGFGLGTLESLSCGKPIICTKTGGLLEQVEYEGGSVGFGIEPESKTLAGSQSVFFIEEHNITKSAFLKAMTDFYNLSQEEREAMGRRGREHVLKNYNFQKHAQRWVEIMEEVHEKHGSWDTRKNYNSVYFKKF